MDFINIIIVVIFIGFLGYEGYRAGQAFFKHRKLVAETISIRKNVHIQKDYIVWCLLYFVFAIILCFFSLTYYKTELYLEAVLFLLFFLFCFVFMMEMIIAKTVVFYDTGFMCNLGHHKYRSVLKITSEKQFLKGYVVKLTNDETVILSKKAVEVLKTYIESYKNAKKENRKESKR